MLQQQAPPREQTLPLTPGWGNSSVEFLHDSVISVLIQNTIGNERYTFLVGDNFATFISQKFIYGPRPVIGTKDRL